MKIETIDDPEAIRISVLLYALTGAGKTHLCGTAQECQYTSPILMVNVNGGPNTLVGKGIDVVTPRNMAEFQEIYTFLRNENTKYKSAAFDGLSGIQTELSMPEIQGTRGAGEVEEYEDFTEGTPPDRRHWLQSHEHIRKIMRGLRDLTRLPKKSRRIHVFITALEKTDERREIVCPQLPGVMGLECGSYVDVLARLSIQTVKKDDAKLTRRHLMMEEYVDRDGFKVLAKNRGNRLGKGMWEPSMDKLMAKWNQKKEA